MAEMGKLIQFLILFLLLLPSAYSARRCLPNEDPFYNCLETGFNVSLTQNWTLKEGINGSYAILNTTSFFLALNANITNLNVSNSLYTSQNLIVAGTINSSKINTTTLNVTGSAEIGSSLTVNNMLQVIGNVSFSDNLTVDTNTLVADSTNNRVGIGTTNPSYSLHVTGGTGNIVAASGGFRTDSGGIGMGQDPTGSYNEIKSIGGITLDATSNDVVRIEVSATDGREALQVAGAMSVGIGYADQTASQDFLNGLIVQGNVGINLTVPNETLAIRGTLSVTSGSGTQGLFQNSVGNVGIGTASPTFKQEINGFSTDGYFGVTSGTTGDVFEIDENGRVGIGRHNPAATLHVLESANALKDIIVAGNPNTGTSAGARFTILVGGDSAGDPYFEISNNVVTWALGMDNSDSNKFKIAYNAALGGAGDILTIDSSGNVGIGTTSPNYLLQVASGTDGRSVNLSNVLYVNATNGSVGISTSASLGKLHIVDRGQTVLYTPAGASTKGLILDSGLGASDGSNANLGVTIYGDADTYAFMHAVHDQNSAIVDLAFGTDGVEYLRITDAGRISIGGSSDRASPDAIVDIEIAATAGATTLEVNGIDSNTGLIARFRSPSVAAPDIVLGTVESESNAYIASERNLILATGQVSQDLGTARLTIVNATGNVGIGTTTPTEKLTVIGGGNFTGNITFGTKTNPINITGFRPDGTRAYCGIDNSNVWSCVST